MGCVRYVGDIYREVAWGLLDLFDYLFFSFGLFFCLFYFGYILGLRLELDWYFYIVLFVLFLRL